MTIPDALLDFRSEFPILERCTYMVSNSLGAMPRTVPERLAEYADQWATHGVRAWAKGWWSMPLALGDEIAPLIGAGAGEGVGSEAEEERGDGEQGEATEWGHGAFCRSGSHWAPNSSVSIAFSARCTLAMLWSCAMYSTRFNITGILRTVH